MNPSDESERAAAARLSIELGTPISRGQIRWWKRKRFDLHDLDKLRAQVRNQQRSNAAVAPAQPTPADHRPTISIEQAAAREKKFLVALVGFVAAMIDAPPDETLTGIAYAAIDGYERGPYGKTLGDSPELIERIKSELS